MIIQIPDPEYLPHQEFDDLIGDHGSQEEWWNRGDDDIGLDHRLRNE